MCKMFHKTCVLAAFCLLVTCGTAWSQQLSISSNLLDWANLGTANVQAGVSVSRHITMHAAARYNPWHYAPGKDGGRFQNCARTAAVALRWWPWNVYSSWWTGARVQVEEYNRGGLFGVQKTEEGLAAGAGIGAGYSRMLSSHLNLDLGIGIWAGRTRYTLYRCPRCGRILSDEVTGEPVKDSRKWFLLPSSDVQVSLTYVF